MITTPITINDVVATARSRGYIPDLEAAPQFVTITRGDVVLNFVFWIGINSNNCLAYDIKDDKKPRAVAGFVDSLAELNKVFDKLESA